MELETLLDPESQKVLDMEPILTYQKEGDIAGIEAEVPGDGLKAGELGSEQVLSQHAGVQVNHLQLVLCKQDILTQRIGQFSFEI
jgi:hypothetical protein